jgi:hypothetical protein
MAASSVQQQLQYQMQMHVAQQLQLDNANLEKDEAGGMVKPHQLVYVAHIFLLLKAASVAVSAAAPNPPL